MFSRGCVQASANRNNTVLWVRGARVDGCRSVCASSLMMGVAGVTGQAAQASDRLPSTCSLAGAAKTDICTKGRCSPKDQKAAPLYLQRSSKTVKCFLQDVSAVLRHQGVPELVPHTNQPAGTPSSVTGSLPFPPCFISSYRPPQCAPVTCRLQFCRQGRGRLRQASGYIMMRGADL